MEAVNLACQGYLEEDLKNLKVEATGAQCKRLNSELTLELEPTRFRRSMDLGNVLFCCVDSIDTRRLIWNATVGRVEFLMGFRF